MAEKLAAPDTRPASDGSVSQSDGKGMSAPLCPHVAAAREGSAEKERIQADLYMSKHCVPNILEWITVELLVARPEKPLLFLRKLFNEASLENVELGEACARCYALVR